MKPTIASILIAFACLASPALQAADGTVIIPIEPQHADAYEQRIVFVRDGSQRDADELIRQGWSVQSVTPLQDNNRGTALVVMVKRK